MLKNLKQIDRFYYVLAVLLTVMAFVVIIMMRTIFGSFETANKVDDASTESSLPRVDKTKLQEVYDTLYTRTPPLLDL